MIHTFQLLATPEEVQRLYEFVRQYPLDYPDYFQWLEKCKKELELGCKNAFSCTDSNGQVVGSIIFQQHKQEPEILEIKNLRVDPSCVQQGIGSVLESLVEWYAKENGFKRIRCDAHSENPVVAFMQKRGYRVEAREGIYTAEKEVVLFKDMK